MNEWIDLKKEYNWGGQHKKDIKILEMYKELYDNCTWTQKALSIWMSNMHHWHVMFYQFRKFNIAHIPIDMFEKCFELQLAQSILN